MLINPKPISNVLGALMVFASVIMLGLAGFSAIMEDGMLSAFLYSALIAGSIGGLSWIFRFSAKAQLTKREGYVIVVLSWFIISLIGMLPYIFCGYVDGWVDAFFESVSGFTTTGATIITDIEIMPKSLLLWRSLTQWLGGMGIIVLTVALFPLLGIAGIELFVAEAPGPTSDKIHPRIKDTARTLWNIYLVLTVLLFGILMLEGLGWFDAINHALTTMATGGFSTKNASIAHYTSPLIQYTIAFFMLLAGTNYAVIYLGLSGKFQKIYENEEWRMYMIVLLVGTVLGVLALVNTVGWDWEPAFRAILFNIISIVTTTGFIANDYLSWNNGFTIFFFILLFTGACAGSTSGGIKLVRHLVFMRNTLLEFKRIIHPRALIRLKINKKLVAPRVIIHILVFLIVYIFLFVIGALLLSFLGLDFETAVGAAATSIGNVGPGMGSVGPLDNFAHLPEMAKLILCFLMICGRLELFTVLVLFTTYFWQRN
ncbi:MAG: trk system potassium uptake protein TrkH [Saprospiraceae bacterium]|jgi:trk system potassium uptake protein TrkH